MQWGRKWVTQRSGALIEDGWTACMYGRAHNKIIRLEIN